MIRTDINHRHAELGFSRWSRGRKLSSASISGNHETLNQVQGDGLLGGYDLGKLSLAVCVMITFGLQSCVSVKEYQKQYLNDPDMELGQRSIERFDAFGETYREGSAGAVSGETGGGCGCY